jgi:hypothetical protein
MGKDHARHLETSPNDLSHFTVFTQKIYQGFIFRTRQVPFLKVATKTDKLQVRFIILASPRQGNLMITREILDGQFLMAVFAVLPNMLGKLHGQPGFELFRQIQLVPTLQG